MKPMTHRLLAQEQDWCLAANRWGARHLVRGYFRMVSRRAMGFMRAASRPKMPSA